MITDYVRDATATAAVFGFFASVWFGWAQEQPPARWRPLLIAGTVVSLLTALAGGVLTWLRWDETTVFDADTSIAFGIVVAIELVLAVAGVMVLALVRKLELAAAWVAFIVGLHLFPVAVLLEFWLLYPVAAAVTVAAAVAVPVARSRSIAVSAVTGVSAGTILLTAGLASLVSSFRPF
jgi:hypothetical protein